MNQIIDPRNNKQYSIFSNQGKKILKLYVEFLRRKHEGEDAQVDEIEEEYQYIFSDFVLERNRQEIVKLQNEHSTTIPRRTKLPRPIDLDDKGFEISVLQKLDLKTKNI